jgi:hypothetical protein
MFSQAKVIQMLSPAIAGVPTELPWPIPALVHISAPSLARNAAT